MRSSTSSSTGTEGRSGPSRRVLGLALLAGLAGCEKRTAQDDEITFRNTCDREDGRRCDVRVAACQAGLFSYVACLREMSLADPSPPSVLVQTSVGDSFKLTPEERRRQDLLGEGLVGFGLQRAGVNLGEAQDADAEESIGGWYDDDKDEITLVLRPDTAPDGDEANSVLAHEFAHALQQRDGTLDRRFEDVRTDDTALARRSFVEGEAVFYEWMLDAVHEDASIWDYSVYPRDFHDDEMDESASPYDWAAARFPYASGVMRVSALWRQEPLDLKGRLDDLQPDLTYNVLFIGRTAALPLRAPSPSDTATDAAFTSLGVVGLDVAMRLALDASLESRDAALRGMTSDRFGSYDERVPVAVWIIACKPAERTLSDLRRLVVALPGLEFVPGPDLDGQTLVALVATSDDSLRVEYAERAALAMAGEPAGLDGALSDNGRDYPEEEPPESASRPLACHRRP